MDFRGPEPTPPPQGTPGVVVTTPEAPPDAGDAGVVLGVLAPLVLDVFAVFGSHAGGALALGLVASVCGLIGGLLLRQLVLTAGIQAPLKAGRFEYVLQNP